MGVGGAGVPAEETERGGGPAAAAAAEETERGGGPAGTAAAHGTRRRSAKKAENHDGTNGRERNSTGKGTTVDVGRRRTSKHKQN